MSTRILYLLLPVLCIAAMSGCTSDDPTDPGNDGGHTPVTLDVPGDHETVAEALWSARSGDTVRVAAGTWLESGLALGAGVTLRGATGDPADVVIDGRHVGSLLTCWYLAEPCRVADLTLRNGSGTDFGAVLVDSSQVTLENCVIESSVATNAGGGIKIRNVSAVTMTDCVLQRNTAELYRGGAVWCGGMSTVVMTDCTVEWNRAVYGGGLWCGGGGVLTLVDCVVSHNSAGTRGGGFCLEGWGSLLAENSVTTGNTAPAGADGTVNTLTGLDWAVLLDCCQYEVERWETDSEPVVIPCDDDLP